LLHRLPALAATNVLTAVLLLGTACGAGIGRAAPLATSEVTAAASPSPRADPTTSADLPSPQADPTSIAATPDVTAVARGSQTFSGTIVHAPGARVRYGPGTDMPVMDVDPVGRTELFDGWFRRADDTPLPDELTGRIEQWSWDWFHLGDGRGWVHSSAVKGRQLPGMPQVAWHPPASLPKATAAVLDIPFHAQDHPVTCEIASLRMALSGRAIDTDERTLLQLTGIDDRPAEDGGGHIVRWGNPNQMFVGDPDGHISSHTGYGVYAGPIARAAARSGVYVLSSGTGTAPSAIYAHVIAGHPAVVWVTSDYRRADVQTWRAWDGSSIPYALTEHTVLIVGVTPAIVLVNDPMKGQVWHSKSEFESAYATFGGMAVIIG